MNESGSEMNQRKEEVGQGIESQAYKIKAFQNENQESFAPFYKMADTLIDAVRMANLSLDWGVDSELLSNLVQSVRKLTPAGPFQENITAKYVQSVVNICDEAEVLATHFSMDQTRIPPQLDKWSEEALAKTVRLCEENRAMLNNYFFEHENPLTCPGFFDPA